MYNSDWFKVHYSPYRKNIQVWQVTSVLLILQEESTILTGSKYITYPAGETYNSDCLLPLQEEHTILTG